MRRLIRHILHINPLITHVIIEDNNGGEYLTRQLASVIPKRIKVVPQFEGVSKLERIRELHDWTQQGWVWNAPGVHAFVEQAQAYPEVDHDDIVDAVAKGVRYHLQNRPLPFAA
jgi:predicted phage terminase large subunit-like protein